MNMILLAAVVAYILTSGLRSAVNLANLRHAEKGGIPLEFSGMVEESKFQESVRYLSAQTRYGLVHRAVGTVLAVGFLLAGGLGWVDGLAARWAEPGTVLHSLLFFLGLGILDQIVELPFSYYHTFALEERFGFNRSSRKTFWGDLAKGWALGIVLGGLLGGAVVWFFLHAGSQAWLWAWLAFTAFQLLLTFLAPVVLMPLFNKFEPLPAGDLRSEIEGFAKKVNFRLQGIFTMDGSKRSTKANAYFTGFGRFRRIVLFDTLVQKHPVPELMAVLAHEVGHFKKKHIPQQILLSLASSFVMFWVFSLLLKSSELAQAFGFPSVSVHAALTIAFWLYAPFSLISSFLVHGLSRRFEFEADAYAREHTGDPAALASALKRLSVESLSNLNPHPWKVLLDYSHPPVVQRIRVLLS